MEKAIAVLQQGTPQSQEEHQRFTTCTSLIEVEELMERLTNDKDLKKMMVRMVV
jgi:hypothetical protein